MDVINICRKAAIKVAARYFYEIDIDELINVGYINSCKAKNEREAYSKAYLYMLNYAYKRFKFKNDEKLREAARSDRLNEHKLPIDDIIDLRDALKYLSHDELYLLQLMYWEGLNYREVAERVGLGSASSAHWKIIQTIKKLEGLLNDNV